MKVRSSYLVALYPSYAACPNGRVRRDEWRDVILASRAGLGRSRSGSVQTAPVRRSVAISSSR